MGQVVVSKKSIPVDFIIVNGKDFVFVEQDGNRQVFESYNIDEGDLKEILFLIPKDVSRAKKKQLPNLIIVNGMEMRLHNMEYVPTKPTEKALASLFDYLAPVYDRKYINVDFNILLYRNMFKIAFSNINPQKRPVKILDYGVGTGISGLALNKHIEKGVLELHGVDISHKMLEISQSRGIIINNVSENSTKYQDKEFDVVFMAFVTNFFSNINPFIETYRLLNSTGQLIFNVYRPSTKNWFPKAQEKLHDLGFVNVNVHHISISIENINRVLPVVHAFKTDIN